MIVKAGRMPGHAFVYGTLMAEEVLNCLIHRVPTMKPAVLKDFVRYKVKGQVYPAIVPAEGSSVRGKVKHSEGMAPRSWLYPGSDYERCYFIYNRCFWT